MLKTKLSLAALLVSVSLLSACGDSTTNIVEKDPIADNGDNHDHDHGDNCGVAERRNQHNRQGQEVNQHEDLELVHIGKRQRRGANTLQGPQGLLQLIEVFAEDRKHGGREPFFINTGVEANAQQTQDSIQRVGVALQIGFDGGR